MFQKKCARCTKVVYPIEELRCLDQTWHKLCFKCNECGTRLTMATYKGFDKVPYCNAHCPQAKHTSVTDTPEGRRLAKLSEQISDAKYREDFVQKVRGRVTNVVDDPETLRAKKVGDLISNTNYLNDRKAQMEAIRYTTATATTTPQQEQQQTTTPTEYEGTATGAVTPDTKNNNNNHAADNTSAPRGMEHYQPPLLPEYRQKPELLGAIEDNVFVPGSVQEKAASLLSKLAPSMAADQASYNMGIIAHPGDATSQQINYMYENVQDVNYNVYSQQQEPTIEYIKNALATPTGSLTNAAAMVLKEAYQQLDDCIMNTPIETPPQTLEMQPEQQQQQPIMEITPLPTYKAMYDYVARDTDEVNIADGDYIIECELIEGGWMIGTNQRTGERGMLPANYVEFVG